MELQFQRSNRSENEFNFETDFPETPKIMDPLDRANVYVGMIKYFDIFESAPDNGRSRPFIIR